MSKRGSLFYGMVSNLLPENLDDKRSIEYVHKQLILEEQNRIANEIHDNVSQKLFSILCAVHALNVNWRKFDDDTISNQLKLIERTTRDTSEELRACIYRLCSSKQKETGFRETIVSYLRDFECLNNVTVKFEFQGDDEGVGYSLKQALCRIIKEATGNAVRHGKCTETHINLTIDMGGILELTIKDNGQGFDDALEKQTNGLGLSNMRTLTKIFGGVFGISSKLGRGSKIKVIIPLGLKTELNLSEGGAA